MQRNDGTDQANFVQQLLDQAALIRRMDALANAGQVQQTNEATAKMLDKAAGIIELYRVRYAANDRVTIDAETDQQAKMEGAMQGGPVDPGDRDRRARPKTVVHVHRDIRS